MCVCMCGFCNVWVCVCMGFVMCACVCGFCKVRVCLCVDFVMCVCVCVCVDFVKCGCVYVLVLFMCVCFGNMCTCIYSVFVLFHLCILFVLSVLV